MKHFIIELLGGYTEEEDRERRVNHQLQLREVTINLKKQMFRKGDSVYIHGDKRFNQERPFFLLEAYNNRTAWLVGYKPDDKNTRCSTWAVSIDSISFEPPKRCYSCNQVINGEK